MRNTILIDRSTELAHATRALVKLCWFRVVDRDTLRQLLRSGTSVGANIRESRFAESPKDFVHKLKIAQKEVSETLYWMELLKHDEFYRSISEFATAWGMANEVYLMLNASIRTLRSRGKL
jgi:four helix bundle protein